MGEAFRRLPSEMDGLGYGLAWRILDAQFFGVARRRRRPFPAGNLGAEPPQRSPLGRKACEGDYPSSREKREALAAEARRGASSAGFEFNQGAGAGNIGFGREQSPTCTSDRHNPAVPAFAQNTRDEVRIRGDGTIGGASSARPGMKRTACVYETANADGTAVAVDPAIGMADLDANTAIGYDTVDTPHAGGDAPSACRRAPVRRSSAADAQEGEGAPVGDEASPTLPTGNTRTLFSEEGGNMTVRRPTPLECERPQGFPDDRTKTPYRGKPADECPDGPRRKAIGDGMAVPVMRWIGERIATAEAGGIS